MAALTIRANVVTEDAQRKDEEITYLKELLRTVKIGASTTKECSEIEISELCRWMNESKREIINRFGRTPQFLESFDAHYYEGVSYAIDKLKRINELRADFDKEYFMGDVSD